MDFTEPIFSVHVDKTAGADFSLTVDVDRVGADNEEAGNIDYDGSVRAFQCDVDTFVQNDDAVRQGSTLGLRGESNTESLVIVRWETLTVSRNGVSFKAIDNGFISAELANLVAPDCETRLGKCTSEVELIGSFFQTDGNLTVDGTVMLGINGKERYLTKIGTPITKHANLRTLQEESNDNAK